MEKKIQNRVYMYQINADDVIVSVNEDWLIFARENDADWITEKSVIGKPLWEFITTGEIRDLYNTILKKVRSSQEKIQLEFRGDSPDERRFVEMKIIPLSDQSVEFQVQNKRVENRKPVLLLDRKVTRSDQQIDFCTWCNAVKTPKGWKEIDDIEEDAPHCPQLRYVFCYRCKADLERQLQDVFQQPS